MKISTKGRYGVRFMLDLALHSGNGCVALKDIAKRQNISEKYLWQVIAPLKSAGLIHSVRGARGGYRLAKTPSQVTVRDIVATLEGPSTFVECIGSPNTCPRAATCAARDMWTELEEALAKAMDGITLDDLIEKHKRKESASTYNYTI